jgi:hypothetical protein
LTKLHYILIRQMPHIAEDNPIWNHLIKQRVTAASRFEYSFIITENAS